MKACVWVGQPQFRILMRAYYILSHCHGPCMMELSTYAYTFDVPTHLSIYGYRALGVLFGYQWVDSDYVESWFFSDLKDPPRVAFSFSSSFSLPLVCVHKSCQHYGKKIWKSIRICGLGSWLWFFCFLNAVTSNLKS